MALGSITLAVVAGIAWGAYQAIAAYPDFKAGLPMVFNDLVEKAPKLAGRFIRQLCRLKGEVNSELETATLDASPAVSVEPPPVGADETLAAEVRRLRSVAESQSEQLAELKAMLVSLSEASAAGAPGSVDT